VRTKCLGKSCVGVWEYSWGPRELPDVGRPGLVEAGHFKWYQSRLSQFHTACGRGCTGMVCMASVGPGWSHNMAHVLALDLRTWPRLDVPGLGLIDEDVDLLRGYI
jgi:hypothetical protein